ncbi:MAG: transcription antiterminator [Sporolactobacillus sp.]
MTMLTSRQLQLLQFLNSEDDFHTIAYFAHKLGISGRTIHTDLQLIDDYLKEKKAQLNIWIERKRGSGIKLDGEQAERQMLMKMISSEPYTKISSTTERKEEIIFLLLNNESAVNFRELADKYFCSISSITNDMQEIENWISQFHLILTKNGHGTWISGTEINIRKAMTSLIQERINRFTNSFDLNKNIYEEKNRQIINLINQFITIDIINRSEKIIHYIEKELNCYFNENYYINMMISIAVMLRRQSDKHFIKRTTHMHNLHLLKTYIIAKETLEIFCNDNNSGTGTTISIGEVNFLNQCIMSTGIEDTIGSDDIKKYDDNVKRLTKKVISLASDALHVDFTNDSILYKGLLVHIDPMINRVKFGMTIKNPLMKQIKEQYPAMFGFTTFLASLVENETHLKLNEDEIGFLMVHFQAAIERNKDAINVIIVCPGGIGTSELVANRIRRLMPNLNICQICAVRNIDTVENLDKIDFIVSTVPLKNINKPVILVSQMMNLTDAKSINNFYLDYLLDKNRRTIHFKYLTDIIDERFIFSNLNFNDKNMIIKFITKKLEKENFITSQFADSLIEREKIATTDLGNKVAIPHGQGKYVNQSVISIATLSNPINWGKSKVSVIILIALRTDEKKSKNIMGDLYNLFDSDPLLNRMINVKTPKELVTLLKAGSNLVLSL